MPNKTTLFIDAGPISTPRMSGIGHATLELTRALLNSKEVRKRYRIKLVSVSSAREQLGLLGLEGASLALLPVPLRVYSRLPGSILAPYLDILLGKGLYLFTNYRCWPLLRSKAITFIYDISYYTHPDTLGERNRRFLAAWVPRWIERSNRIAVISNYVSEELTGHLGVHKDKLIHIPCGVDAKHFRAVSAEEVERVRTEYELPKEYVLFFGNIEPRKNLARLIRAYRDLPATTKSKYPLVLVGGATWNSDEIEAEVAAARAAGESITVPGKYVEDKDLPALYTGARLLAHPALYEGFGLAPLQAMACGLPVLVGNNSAMPEVVGDVGLKVDATSEASITAGLKSGLADESLRDKLISGGPVRAAEFSWSVSAHTLFEALGRLEASS